MNDDFDRSIFGILRVTAQLYLMSRVRLQTRMRAQTQREEMKTGHVNAEANTVHSHRTDHEHPSLVLISVIKLALD